MIFSCDNLQESIRKSNGHLSVTSGKVSWAAFMTLFPLDTIQTSQQFLVRLSNPASCL